MMLQMVMVIMLMGMVMRVMMTFTMHRNDDHHGHQEDGSPRVCLALPGLTEQQANVCEKLPETVESVPFGTKQVGSPFLYSIIKQIEHIEHIEHSPCPLAPSR